MTILNHSLKLNLAYFTEAKKMDKISNNRKLELIFKNLNKHINLNLYYIFLHDDK
jgi:hypothetical protein